MNAAEMDSWGRHRGDGVDGSVQRPVRCVVRITGLSELASVEIFGHSASPQRRLRNFEDYVSGQARPYYPVEAPSASATCRKVDRNGNDEGRCTTTRRTEPITRAPSLMRMRRCRGQVWAA